RQPLATAFVRGQAVRRVPAGDQARVAWEIRPMQNRRNFLLTLTAGVVALAVIITPVIADELLGVITKIDVAGKKVTVESKEDGKIGRASCRETGVLTDEGGSCK